MLKNGIEPTNKPIFIIKSERLRDIDCWTVSMGYGLLNQDEIFINNKRKNLTKSSIRTNRSRTIFEVMRIIRRAKLYVLKYIFQLCQSVYCVRTINAKQKHETNQ